MRCLLIRLEAPLMSWGGPLLDMTPAPNQDFPPLSMMVGLIANAMGLERYDHQPHQDLQERIIIASRIDREPAQPNLEDYQTADLRVDDRVWTTQGKPRGRGGEASKYRYHHPTQRIYLQDVSATVAIALDPEAGQVTVDTIADALDRPFRPLHIGRKTCIPSHRLHAGIADSESPLDALLSHPLSWRHPLQPEVRMQWTEEQAHQHLPVHVASANAVTDLRDWRSRLHGGHRYVLQGAAPVAAFPVPQEEIPVP